MSAQEARILVVENEPTVSAVLREMLEREGYEVLGAADGASGLEAFRSQPGAIALVLLDLKLPDVTGFQLLEGLQTVDEQVKVIVMTGGSKATVPPFVPFLRKPFARELLLQTVEGVLS